MGTSSGSTGSNFEIYEERHISLGKAYILEREGCWRESRGPLKPPEAPRGGVLARPRVCIRYPQMLLANLLGASWWVGVGSGEVRVLQFARGRGPNFAAAPAAQTPVGSS